MHTIRFLPQTPLGELTALPQIPLAGFKGPTSNGREGWKDRREGQGSGKERRGPTSKARLRRREERGERVSPPNLKSKLRPWA